MSTTKAEKSSSKTHLKADMEEECDSNAGKPCIDFQPDDRWHIKEEPEEPEEPNNSKRRRSSRKRKGSAQRSARAKKPAAAVNGEISRVEADENDAGHEEPTSKGQDSLKELPIKIEPQIAKEDSEIDMSVVKQEAKDEDLSPEKDNCVPASIKELNPPAETNGMDMMVSNCTSTAIKKEESSPSSDVPVKLEQSQDSTSNTETKDSRSAPVLKDERTEDTAADNSKRGTFTGEETSKEQSMPELSSNENSQSSFKKDDGDVAIIEEKLLTVNSEENESDNEVQIISGKESPKEHVVDDKLIEQSFTKDKSLSEKERRLSPGYIYFNSLQEKMPEFTAGKYKPVKFPHMGTLMLEENEVIIESPSLLVPLLIKESDKFPKLVEDTGDSASRPKAVRRNFFQSSVGEFLINLGGSRVLEWYYKDLRRTKAKQLRKSPADTASQNALVEYQNNLCKAKKRNAPFNFPLQKCKFCDFKTESSLVLEGHYLIPHVTSRREFRCSFCDYLCRDPQQMSFHFEAIHDKKVASGDQATYFECLFCSFHSQLRSKLKVHMNRCRKYFLPSQNQSPPFDFEFPGVTTKPVTISDVIAHRRMLMGSTKSPYSNQAQSSNVDMANALARKKLASVLSLTGAESFPDSPTLIKHLIGPSSKPGTPGFQVPPNILLTRPRVRAQQMRQPSPGMQARIPGLRGSTPRNPSPFPAVLTSTASHLASSGISITPINKQDPSSARMSVGSQGGMKNITLTPISSAGNLVSQKPGPPQPIALFTNVAGSEISKARAGMLPLSQPRLQLPPGGRGSRMTVPYQRLNTPPSQVVKTGSGSSFVLCEICDSYIKDLEELRSHMNWVHKVKIHPKMLVSRPPLNCQKCQWRFFTDQGLERHLLGAHGLVTTNMQEMANKNQDGGRCIICGAVFTYKLVSHMTQVHKVTLKPAHLSYKCTVCTATFTLYRLFESHVYNVHSASAKRPAEEPAPAAAQEPPAKKKAPPVEEPKPEPLSSNKCSECGQAVDDLQKHIIQNHLKECHVKLCRIEKCNKCLYSSNELLVIRMSDFKGLMGSDEESSDDEDDSEASSESSSEDDKKATENSMEVEASGSKEVEASGSKKVEASGSKEVEASGSKEVEADGKA